MIEREEIDQMAASLGVTVANVERDYLFGWLLAGLFHETRLGNSVSLKGGNALRKGYSPLARFSSDLDFSSPMALDQNYILQELNQVCRLVEAKTGVSFDLDRNKVNPARQIDQHKNVYKGALYFKDFADQGDHVSISIRVDVAEFDQLHLPVQSRALIHQYSDSTELQSSIRVVQLEEALADKLKCLLQRRSCFDLFDAVFGLFGPTALQLHRDELVRVFLKKTVFGPAPSVASRLLQKLPFEILRPFWNKVVCPSDSRLSFEDATKRLVDGVVELFAPFSRWRGADLAYFPAEMRNPILEAGSSRKLLRVRYHGALRLVETYEIAFKRRKDGIAQEYLYVWDRTGGSTGPGVKSFIPSSIGSIELTDESFDPRFDVDLGKAGGVESSSQFRSGPRVHRLIGWSSRRTSRAARRQFSVRCVICGRQFSRTTSSLSVRPHQSPAGIACVGRSGYREF